MCPSACSSISGGSALTQSGRRQPCCGCTGPQHGAQHQMRAVPCLLPRYVAEQSLVFSVFLKHYACMFIHSTLTEMKLRSYWRTDTNRISGVFRILWRGGQSQRREVRGANGVECGEWVSPPHWRKGLGRGLCPLPRNLKKNFLVQCVQKFFVFRPKGGGGHRPVPPPA